MSDDHDSQARPRRVYWLPNLLTTGALFAGFYAVVAAIDLRFEYAGIAVFVAMFFDGLDGRVARWTNTASAFGKEYDSLSDMVSFGVAPAIVTYQWGVARIAEYGPLWRRVGWLVCFFYAAAAALRLARFNSRSATQDKQYFEGLPSPAAAGIVAALIWLASGLTDVGLPGLVLAFLVTASAGALMISRFRLQQLQAHQRRRQGALHLHHPGAARLHPHFFASADQPARHFRPVCAISPGPMGLSQAAPQKSRSGPPP